MKRNELFISFDSEIRFSKVSRHFQRTLYTIDQLLQGRFTRFVYVESVQNHCQF